MVDSKHNLILALDGALATYEDLPERILQENMFDENGFVDGEFLTAILSFMARVQKLNSDVIKSCGKLLGIPDEDPQEVKKKKDKEGKKWRPEEILKNSTFSDNILRLPKVQLNSKSYDEVKKWIMEAGGKWQGGKTQGFVFDFDATRVVGILMSGKRCNLQQDFQFFATPAELADWLVSLGNPINNRDAVLEPSAGSGSIIHAIHRVAPDVEVDCFELMPENVQKLEKLDHVNIIGEDFTKGVPKLYNHIYANPPFSKNQDIQHVRAMYDALDPNNGVVCAITSRHWMLGQEKECVVFRDWLEEVKAEIHDIPEGTFRESGTQVATAAIVIKRNGQFEEK